MIIRLVAAVCLLALSTTAGLAAKEVVSFAYLQRENDPAYEPHRAYTGLTLRDRKPPLDGAKTALRESRVLGRALGVKFELQEKVLGAADDPVAAIEALAADGTQIFLLDLPLADVARAAAALAAEDLLLFNITGSNLQAHRYSLPLPLVVLGPWLQAITLVEVNANASLLEL